MKKIALNVLLVIGFWSSSNAFAGDTTHQFQLSDGSILIGQIVNETDEAYLIKLTSGEVRRVAYSQIKRGTIIDEPNSSAKPSTDSASADSMEVADRIQEVSLLEPPQDPEIDRETPAELEADLNESTQEIQVDLSKCDPLLQLSERMQKRAAKNTEQEIIFAGDLLARGRLRTKQHNVMVSRLEELFAMAAAASHCGVEGFDTTQVEFYLQRQKEVRSMYIE